MDRRGFLVGSGLFIAGASACDGASKPPLSIARAQRSMPSLEGAVEWFNAAPLTVQQMRGKVVLVQFWTYSCINWMRTLPHVRAWAGKYRSKGLVVVGVHSPEFEFEKERDKVREAVSQLNVNYPVALDTRHAVWRAFRNSYWPALYFVDANGIIRHEHFGEGEYEQSERTIQALLTRAGANDVETDLVQVSGTGGQAQPDWSNLRSPEIYLGHGRARSFASPSGFSYGRTRTYSAPQRLGMNSWALVGDWTVGPEAVSLAGANGQLSCRFHARDLHLVMGPARRGKVPFRILIDGNPPGVAHGVDIDAEGRGLVVEHRLYQLVRQPGRVQEAQFEIQFLEPGVEAFAFTFG